VRANIIFRLIGGILLVSEGALLACGDEGANGGDTDPPATPGSSSGTPSVGDAGPGVTGGGGTITGSVNNDPAFATVSVAYLIGASDSPADTTVVYVFSKAVGCNDISAVGWDTRVPQDAQFVELKMNGTTAPATFTVVTRLSTAPGEANTNYTMAVKEQVASGGSVTLATLVPKTSASGSFAVTFQAGKLDGAFDAVWCEKGVEP
jgi:hypothetical protein